MSELLCSNKILYLSDSSTVIGLMNSDINELGYNEFKSKIEQCSGTTTVDRQLNKLDSYISIYPNPFIDLLTVVADIDAELNARYELYDIHGRLVKEGHFILHHWSPLPLKSISPGSYILKLEINNYSMQRRLIKM